MKKRLFTLLCAIFLLLSLCACQPSQTGEPTQTTQNAETTQTTEATEPPETLPSEPDFLITASHAFVYDYTGDTLLYTVGDTTDRVAPASLTKLFTAYVALQYLDPSEIITAGEEVTFVAPGSTMAFIYQDQQVTVSMCVEGMLLNSGNDAAYILSAAAGRAIAQNPDLSAQAAVSTFVGEMNAQAKALGLADTHFLNPDGIDAAGHYTTIPDLIRIASVSYENEMIRKFSALPADNVVYASGQICSWYNTNQLLHEDSDYYCPAAIGLKTGSTNGAGKCLISAFETEEGILLIGVLGCSEDRDRYEDTLKLYSHYTGVPINLPESDDTNTISGDPT